MAKINNVTLRGLLCLQYKSTRILRNVGNFNSPYVRTQHVPKMLSFRYGMFSVKLIKMASLLVNVCRKQPSWISHNWNLWNLQVLSVCRWSYNVPAALTNQAEAGVTGNAAVTQLQQCYKLRSKRLFSRIPPSFAQRQPSSRFPAEDARRTHGKIRGAL